MAKHTPGPWTFERLRAGSIWAIQAGATCVAEIVRWATTDPAALAEREANARLIAAAPELLEALERLLEAYSSQMRSDYDYPGDPWTAEGRHDEDALQAIRTIAKAKGEQL
ncbi:hypothetical protein D3C77_48850 [compost metagenome]